MTRLERTDTYTQIMLEADKAGGRQAIDAAERELCKRDLFYLLAYACGRADVRASDFLFERCQEVQESPDGHLDLWAREHYKSTVITFAKTIQDILCDPTVTVGIFSHTKPIARGFLRQIKYELETNERLKQLFPEILYQNPKTDAPAIGNSWSEDKGITVKRDCNDKESTVEAHGLVDGQPTGKHFKLLVYDDVVTLESVNTPEMILKTTDALALSYNLGAHGGRRRFIGTRYHFADTYAEILTRGTATPRVHPATKDGTTTGEPVFLSREVNAEKRRDMGPLIYSCQMLQNPLAASSCSFNIDWLRHWPAKNHGGLNLYLIVDPAHSKKKGSDYSAFFVIGLGPDLKLYVADMVRDRLNLGERTETLFHLHRRYRPLKTGYERYGLQSDIEHIQGEMERENYRFDITELGGATAKVDRIARLIPKFERGDVYLPAYRMYRDAEGKDVDLVKAFITEEFIHWPVSAHDDMLDCLSRIDDMEPVYPSRLFEPNTAEETYEEAY